MADYASKSISLKNYRGPLFKIINLGNYQLIKNLEGIKTATELPESIKKLIGETNPVYWPGAFKPGKD